MALSEVQTADWKRASSETIARMVDLDLDELEDVVGRQASQTYAAPGQSWDGQRIRRLLQRLHEAAADILQGNPCCHLSRLCCCFRAILVVRIQNLSKSILPATLDGLVCSLQSCLLLFLWCCKHAAGLDINCIAAGADV